MLPACFEEDDDSGGSDSADDDNSPDCTTTTTTSTASTTSTVAPTTTTSTVASTSTTPTTTTAVSTTSTAVTTTTANTSTVSTTTSTTTIPTSTSTVSSTSSSTTSIIPGLTLEYIAGGEPGYYSSTAIAVADDGTVYLAMAKGRMLAVYIFDEEGSPYEGVAFAGQDPSMALDSNGALHVAYFDDQYEDLGYATNASGQWVAQRLHSSGDMHGAPSLALDAQDHVHISYYDISFSALKYATNKSGSWVIETVDGQNDSAGLYSSLTLDANDAVHIVYSRFVTKYTCELTHATNASGQWVTQVLPLDQWQHQKCGLAVDAAGHLHLAYTHGDSAWLAYATDASGQWEVEVVDNESAAGQYPSLQLDAQEHVHISHLHVVSSYVSELRYSTNQTGGWVTATVAGGSGYYKQGYGNDLKLDADGHAHISHLENHNYYLKYATNVDDTWMNYEVDTGDAYCMPSLVLNGDDDVITDVYGGDSENWGIYLFENATGPWLVDLYIADAHLWSNSLTMDADGYLHLIFSEWQTKNLFYATDKSGDWVIEELTFAGEESLTPTLALDGDGYAHIAFCDATEYLNGELIYATNSSGAWVASLVDDERDVGYFPSLMLADDGTVHITYIDDVVNRIKYAYGAPDAWTIQEVPTEDIIDYGYYSFILDSDDALHLVYLSDDIHYVTNAGGSWLEQTIADCTYSYSPPALAIGANAHVHVLFREYIPDKSSYVLSYATNAGGDWTTHIIDAYGLHIGLYYALYLDDNDIAHTIYSVDEGLYYATFPVD